MTYKCLAIETTKDFFIKVILPIIVILILFFTADICYLQKTLVTATDSNNELGNIFCGIVSSQATMITLIITALSLLSSFITKSYFGMTICSFYLETKPVIFKFKYVAIAEYTLLSLGWLFCIFQLYLCVALVWTISLLLIGLTVNNIYKVFVSKNNAYTDIREYFSNQIRNEKQYVNKGKDFIDDWKHNISNQSMEEFYDYINSFKELIKVLILKEQSLKLINSFSEKIATTLLDSNNQNNHIKVLVFISEFYEYLCSNDLYEFICSHNLSINAKHECITLFDRTYRKWFQLLDLLDIDIIQKYINLRDFLRNVISTNLLFSSNPSTEDVRTVHIIAQNIGKILKNKEEKGQKTKADYWENLIINNHEDYFYHKKKSFYDTYSESIALLNFYIGCSYILNGKVNLVEKGVFSCGPCNLFQRVHEYTLMETMLIHCYMYYLAFYKKESKEIKPLVNGIRNSLLSSDVKFLINLFINEIESNPNLLKKDLRIKIEDILNDYEFYSPSTEKIPNIQDVVYEYILYIALKVNFYTVGTFDLSDFIDLENSYSYLTENGTIKIQQRLFNVRHIFEEEDVFSENFVADYFIPPFFKIINNKYKEKLLCDRDNAYKNINRFKKALKDSFVEHYFMLTETVRADNYYTFSKNFNLTIGLFPFSILLPLGQDCTPLYFQQITDKIIDRIATELLQKFKDNKRNKNLDYDNDSEFRNKYKLSKGAFSKNGIATYSGNISLRLEDITFTINESHSKFTPCTSNQNPKEEFSYTCIDGKILKFEGTELDKYANIEPESITINCKVSVNIRDTAKFFIIVWP